MKPTLCLFTDSSEPSGMGQHMLLLAAELREQYSISFICDGATTLARTAKGLGYETHHLPTDYIELVELLKQTRPQIFHCHAGIGWEGQLGVRAAHQAGIKAVVRTEHLPFLITEPQQHRAYMTRIEQVDALICVSHAARATFERAGVEAHRLHVVQNGIAPAAERDIEGTGERVERLAENARLILTVGRMTEQKGHSYLLDAVRPVLAEHPEALFMLVGSGPLEEPLQRQAQALGIVENVHFASGAVDVGRLMQTCDIFVLPSLFEGLPLVALEAMSAGKPVVGTRVCGTIEAVADGETGLLVEPRHPQALAQAINTLLADSPLAERLGVAGRRRVQEHFTAARMARQTEQIYSTLTAVGGPPQHSETHGGPQDTNQDTNTVLITV